MRYGILILAVLLVTPAAAVHAGEDWPSMRGPDGSGSANSGHTLLSDPGKVKLLWKSEEQDIPGGYFWPIKHGAQGISGGFCGPVVAEGVVVLAYYRPSGEVFDAEGVKKSIEMGLDKPRSWLERRWSVNADDIVIGIDAETGKTRWKRCFEERGLNHSYEMAGPLLTPCIADGRVYAVGSAGRVYCIDIEDGRAAWATSDWPGGRHFESVRQTCLAKRKIPFFHQNSYSLCSGPAVAAGVVAVNDYCGNWRKRKNEGLAGLDAASGRLLWHVHECMGGVTSPIRWTHKGKEYFLAAAPDRLACIEPATGKVVWDYRGHVNKLGTPAISGDIIVCAGTGGGFAPKRPFKEPQRVGLTAFRMDAKGPSRLWALPPEKAGFWTSPSIYRGHAYAYVNKGLLCVELETGNVRAFARFRYGGHYSSLLVADGRLLSRTVLYNADPEDFRALGPLQVGRNRIQLEVFTTPAIADGRLYVRAPRKGRSYYRQKTTAPGCVYCYDLRSPE
jgi:outer membrane protein assembly factor BamB